VVHVNHEGDSTIFAMSSRSEGSDSSDYEVTSLEKEVEIPSFWTWRVDSPFWRPPGVDDSVRRVVFTSCSIVDCWLVQLCCDLQGNPVIDVGAKIEKEVREILKYYPSVKEVVLRGETPQIDQPEMKEFPFDVAKSVSGHWMKEQIVTKLEEMQENSLLKRSVFGFDDEDVMKLEFIRPVTIEGRLVYTMKEYDKLDCELHVDRQ
jgi:hypothetical protein